MKIQNGFVAIVDHVRLLAADADRQNGWMHPCGWTRDEPWEHHREHAPCAPISELADGFDDMWPLWRESLAAELTSPMEAALDELARVLGDLGEAAYVDELSTLDGPDWDSVRAAAARTLAVLTDPAPRGR